MSDNVCKAAAKSKYLYTRVTRDASSRSAAVSYMFWHSVSSAAACPSITPLIAVVDSKAAAAILPPSAADTAAPSAASCHKSSHTKTQELNQQGSTLSLPSTSLASFSLPEETSAAADATASVSFVVAAATHLCAAAAELVAAVDWDNMLAAVSVLC